MANNNEASSSATEFNFTENGRPVIRIGTWNVQAFHEKSPRFDEDLSAVAKAIDENKLSLVALQEVQSEEALIKLCEKLNGKDQRKVNWDYQLTKVGRGYQRYEYGAFLYNKEDGVNLTDSWIRNERERIKDEEERIKDEEKSVKKVKSENDSQQVKFTRAPWLCDFKVGELSLRLLSVHLKAQDSRGATQTRDEIELLAIDILPGLITDLPIVLLGDFNLEPSDQAFESIKELGYTIKLSKDEFTNVGNTYCYDNALMSKEANKKYTGTKEIVRQCGGHIASDHCLVYFQFYTDGQGSESKLSSCDEPKKPIGVIREDYIMRALDDLIFRLRLMFHDWK